jgi:N-acetyl sugar amidotransferase
MPNTRPDTPFLDGICSACLSYQKRPEIDWDARKAELIALLDRHDGRCIVPSSGGKDSHWQALTLKALGADVTCITATTDHLSDIGKRNIHNLARYCDTIEVTPDRTVRNKIARIGLRMVGDISFGEHMAIWATPHQMAIKLGIPLIFYGESPQNEMGGPIGTETETRMTRRWVTEFGGFLGLRATDLVGIDGITERDIQPYLQPTDAQMGGIQTYFLGQFLGWDGLRNAEVAREHGFEWWHTDVEASIGGYESLDNHQTGIHEWFKYLKYGYMRPTDIASLAIRRGRMNRDEALALISEREVFPATYLGVRYENILERIGVDVIEFDTICNQFTDKAVHS